MTADDFWTHAMRSAYRPLNAIERCALVDLLQQDVQAGQSDRYHAGVPVLRDDGAAQVLALTVERVPAYAALYAARGWSESFVLAPAGETV